jgi:hypothetical protein
MSKVRSAKRTQQQIVRRPTKGMPTPLAVPKSRGALLREAPDWPLYECLLSKDWQRPGEIVQAVVARRSPAGQIAAGLFLIDLGCLGIKNGYTRLFASEQEYRQLRKQVEQSQQMGRADLDLVAKIIREATVYAQGLGFAPHPDSRRGMSLLTGANPAACDIPIPLGDGTGKPFYIAGPHDNARAIVAQLERVRGPGGYDYLVQLHGSEELLYAEEE